jgi:heme O synthase-like polyprenyltransferase
MRATIPLSHLQLPSPPDSAARLADFVSLMKPRVAVLAIAAGAGAAGVRNMWYDAEIDAVMPSTAGRPIPCGMVSRAEALAFGLVESGSPVDAFGTSRSKSCVTNQGGEEPRY